MPGLTKMRIESYSSLEFKESDKLEAFTAMFNPAKYDEKYEIEYEENQGQGSSGNTQKFSRIKPKDYSFEFIFDGTGASTTATDVGDAIEHFLTVTAKVNGDIHRPPYLKISWGRLVVRCVLKSATVNYTLFKPDGFPLRAKVQATFSESVDDTQRVAEEGRNSPDLSHTRIVREGDRLATLAYEIYGDPAHYRRLARYNGLTEFRRVPAGTAINLPPLTTLMADAYRD